MPRWQIGPPGDDYDYDNYDDDDDDDDDDDELRPIHPPTVPHFDKNIYIEFVTFKSTVLKWNEWKF